MWASDWQCYLPCQKPNSYIDNFSASSVCCEIQKRLRIAALFSHLCHWSFPRCFLLAPFMSCFACQSWLHPQKSKQCSRIHTEFKNSLRIQQEVHIVFCISYFTVHGKNQHASKGTIHLPESVSLHVDKAQLRASMESPFTLFVYLWLSEPI